MIRILTLVLLAGLLSPLTGSAQYISPERDMIADTALSGSWRGNVISQMGMRYQLLIHIEAMANGDCSVRYDIVDQQQFNRHMTSASCEAGRMLFTNDSVNASFEGRFYADRQIIEGVWRQQRTVAPMILYKVHPVVRFQEPAGSVPYETRHVTVDNLDLGVRLTGTLFVPTKTGQHPLIVMISDRGDHDRDGTDPSGHRPFLVLADAFARHGWASLRLDDRGKGGSSDLPDLGMDELISDITAAVDQGSREQNIDGTNVILLGHGEGGLIAAEVARRRPYVVKGVVFAATPAMESKHWFVAAAQEKDRLMGVDEDVTRSAVQTVATWYDIVASTDDEDRIVRLIGMVTDTMVARHRELMSVYPMAVRLTRHDRDEHIRNEIIPWIREFQDADPSHRIGELVVPSLVLLAANDVLVPARYNEPAWEAVARDQRDVQIELISGVNHGFQECIECTQQEAAHTPQTVRPSVIDEILAWSGRRINRR